MLRIRKGGKSHIDKVVEDVQKLEEVPLNNKISKELHRKFKIRTMVDNTTMKKKLIEFITLYVEE